jgi:YHS domain-containing protein
MTRTSKCLNAALFILMLGATALAQQDAAIYTVKNGLALSGYDGVAYFKDSKPTLGKPELSYQWMDATWLFSTPENLAAFKADPEAYAPQYGGYCAFGTSQGHLVPGDPAAWKIVDSKLYLNYNKEVQGFWLQDIPGYVKKADALYPTLHK